MPAQKLVLFLYEQKWIFNSSWLINLVVYRDYLCLLLWWFQSFVAKVNFPIHNKWFRCLLRLVARPPTGPSRPPPPPPRPPASTVFQQSIFNLTTIINQVLLYYDPCFDKELLLGSQTSSSSFSVPTALPLRMDIPINQQFQAHAGLHWRKTVRVWREEGRRKKKMYLWICPKYVYFSIDKRRVNVLFYITGPWAMCVAMPRKWTFDT